MENIAGFLGCRPQLWRLLGKPTMLFIFLFGPMAPYQDRLHGYGANPKVVQEMVEQMSPLPLERILQHLVVFAMKPVFIFFDKLGKIRFRPVF